VHDGMVYIVLKLCIERRRWEYGQRRLSSVSRGSTMRVGWGSTVLEPWVDKGVFELEMLT
jgi:hypothetical protein